MAQFFIEATLLNYGSGAFVLVDHEHIHLNEYGLEILNHFNSHQQRYRHEVREHENPRSNSHQENQEWESLKNWLVLEIVLLLQGKIVRLRLVLIVKN